MSHIAMMISSDSHIYCANILIFVSNRGACEDAAGEDFACYLPFGLYSSFKMLSLILHLS